MGNTAEDYGRWIVKNKHLKGTPEFNKVAEAYQKSKTTERNPYAGSGVFDKQVLGTDNSTNPDGTLVSRELKRGGLRTLSTVPSALATFSATQLGDAATLEGETGENNLIMQTFKEMSGLQPEAIQGLMTSRGADFSTAESASMELHKMGMGSRAQNFLDVYNTKKANADRVINEAGREDKLIESGVTNLQTARELNEKASEIPHHVMSARFAKLHAEHKDDSVKALLNDAFGDPLGFGVYLAEIMVQSAPQILAGLATRAITKNPAAGLTVLGGGTALQEFGPSVDAFLQQNGIDANLSKEDAVALLKNKDLLQKASKVGAQRAVLITLFEALGMGAAGKGIIKNLAVNAGAGSLGEATAQKVTQPLTGLPLNPREIVLEGLAEMGQAPVEALIVKARDRKPKNAGGPFIRNEDGTFTLKTQDGLSKIEAQAYSSLAVELNRIVEAGLKDGTAYNTMDLDPDSPSGAKGVLDATQKDLVGQLNELVGVLKKKGGPLNTNEAKSLDELMLIVKAKVAQSMGRNKVKGQVGRDNYDALETLVGDSKEGQELIRTLMKLDALTQLNSQGLQGKLSEFTDKFSPFGKIGGKDYGLGDKAKTTFKPVISGIAAANTYGTSLIPQLAIPYIGRKIDKARGTYSVLDKYIKDNIKGDPLDAPTGPSILAAKALEQQRNKLLDEKKAYDKVLAEAKKAYEDRLLIEQKEADAKEAAKRNLPPHPDSPQGTLETATGLNRSQVASILRIVKRIPRLSKRLKDGISDYEQSVGKGGKVGPINDNVLNDIIRHVGGMAEELGITPPRPGNPDQGGPSNTQLETPAISRGIADNQEVIGKLTEKAQVEVPLESYSGPLFEALDKLKLNLGTDPEGAAKQIIVEATVEGVPREAVKEYLMPYVDRIAKQQKNKGNNTPPVVDQTTPVLDQTTENSTALNQYKNLTKGNDVLPGAPKFDKPSGTIESEVEFETPADPVETQLNLIKEPGNKNQTKLRGDKIDAISGMSLEALEAMTEDQMLMMTTVEYNHYDKMLNDRIREDANLEPEDNASEKPTVAQSKEATKKFNELYPDPTIESQGKTRESKFPPIPRDGPALNQMPTVLDILPDVNEVEAMRDPSFKPEVKRSKEAAAQFLQDRWEKATGRTEPFEYTEENVDVISDIMVAEAERNLDSDGNAIGWYDVKIKAAKKIVSIIEPRIMQSADSEAMFDFALAVTSNGQAVTGNFKLALEVFRTGMDTGLLPENFNKGGDRAEAMKSAFKFYNAFGRSGANMPIQQFLDQDFTVKELKDYINRFNSNNGTQIKVGGQETVDTQVKGSYILGPKIGQGFYQNIRGNYNPLTMDLWWMRTWNRMVGRPFESKKTDAVMTRNRDKIATEIKKGGKVENQLVKETLKELGETKKGLYKDPKRMDVFVLALDKNWQKYFRNYQKENNKKNPPKPQLFKSTGTHVLNSSPQMQAQPSGPDRPYMRKVVEKAREKLRGRGIDIETADFQALMWYPEKLLYKKLGVDPGNGSDTDYQDAATILAQNEGITDGQIEETLSDADRGGAVDSRPDTRQQDGRLYPGASPTGPIAPEGPGNLTRQSRGPALTSPEGNQPRTNPPDVRRLKPYVEPAKTAFEIGKKGGKYEDGIGTLGEALELARALNLTVTFLNEMPEGQVGEYTGIPDVKGADGLIRSTTKAKVRVLKQGADHPMFTGAVRSVEEFTTLMHEIGHGLAIERADRVPSAEYREAKNPFVLAKQALESVKVGSFEDFILDAMENYGRENEVLKEIVDLQENMDVEIAKRPELGTNAVRPIRQLAEYIKSNPILRSKLDDNEIQEINNKFRRTYLSTVSEMAVDPLWVYLINPKLLKKAAPQTARAIREVFNKMGGNNPVTFHSYPLATIMAIVMGVVANLSEEEEKRNAQPPPPPGALSPDMNMGALSA